MARSVRSVVVGLCLGPMAWSPGAAVAADPAIVPKPVSMRLQDGTFRISRTTRVAASSEAVGEALGLIDALSSPLGWRLPLVDAGSATSDAIRLTLDPSVEDAIGDEGYSLKVAPERVELRAAARSPSRRSTPSSPSPAC